MDLRKIKKLIDLLEESNLAEIEIKEGEESVRLARTPKGSIAMAAPVMQAAPVAPACAWLLVVRRVVRLAAQRQNRIRSASPRLICFDILMVHSYSPLNVHSLVRPELNPSCTLRELKVLFR